MNLNSQLLENSCETLKDYVDLVYKSKILNKRMKKKTKKKYNWIIGIVIVIFFISLIIFVNKSKPLFIIFEVVEGNSIREVETEPLSTDLLNKEVTLFGLLHDTGAINIFYAHRFDGEKVYTRSYYLKERIFKDRLKSIWVKLNGKYSSIEYGKEEIDATSFERLGEIENKIENAKYYSCNIVKERRRFFDLNNYKKTNRFKNAFSDFQNVNLNMLPFRPDSNLTFIDFDKMISGFDCGKVILRETMIRGDYLTYHAIYDLNSENLVKVIIVNTGYFME